jgi:hypothetical protein
MYQIGESGHHAEDQPDDQHDHVHLLLDEQGDLGVGLVLHDTATLHEVLHRAVQLVVVVDVDRLFVGRSHRRAP